MKLDFEVFKAFLARLDEVQEELLYYPGDGIGVGVGNVGGIGVSKMLKLKFFYVMGKVLSGELSFPVTGLVLFGFKIFSACILLKH